MIVRGTISGVAMTWRYCISRERVDGEDEDVYEIRELYTSDDGELSWTKDAIGPCGSSFAEIVEDLAHMTEAAKREVLDLTLDPPRLVEMSELRSAQ